jgi:glycosyltransferase involved in cell wall biosynthesis
MQGNERLMHISHTDVRADSRILKEVNALHTAALGRLIAVGLGSADGAPVSDTPPEVDFIALDSMARRLKRSRWIPSSMRYAIGLVHSSYYVLRVGLRERPRVVHCHDVIFLHIGVLLKLLCRSKVVYDAHELESAKNGISRRLSSAISVTERLFWPMVDHLVSVSPAILEWYRDNRGPKPSTLVLNSPMYSQVKHRSTVKLHYFHEQFAIPPDRKMFIYVGEMCRGRGIEQLLKVFSHPSIRSHLVLMGYGDTIGVADHARHFPYIHIHPAVPHDQVVDFVREADVGLCLIENVSLSDYFCLPNKLFEYAFAGVPVLASRLPEIVKVVNRYNLGICCDNDVESIRNAVKKIEQDGLEKPQGDLSELSWETQAKRLQDAYRVLLGEGARPAPNSEGND